MRCRTMSNKGDLRAAFLDSATSLIAEKGVEGLSVAEIARTLGVSGSMPYQHFADRRALLAAAAAQAGRQLADDMRSAITDSLDPSGAGLDAADALAAAAAAYVKFVVERRAGIEFIFADELTGVRHPELTAARREIVDVLLPLAISVTGDPATALRLLDQHLAAAHGLGALYINGYHGCQPVSIDAVATEAVHITRTLAATVATAS